MEDLKCVNGEYGNVFLCIDLKSFYASVECVERGLDPMTTDLVVADPTRGDRTICLAVSPSLRARGVSGRARVFQIPKSFEYIMATPRMQLYIDYAAEIYKIYLDYIAPEDMHVYSIDEVFLDVTHYLKRYGLSPKQMAEMLMNEVYRRVGVRATAGVGTNMYLCKIALDIISKHAPDFIGVLDEESYRELLWDHTPLTDFWRIGSATARRLAKIGITTMRGIAEADEELLYRMFGIDAELMIDHANGIEPTTIADIKGYKNKSHSLSRGQVLMRDYSNDEGELIIKEMTELLCHELSDSGMVTKKEFGLERTTDERCGRDVVVDNDVAGAEDVVGEANITHDSTTGSTIGKHSVDADGAVVGSAMGDGHEFGFPLVVVGESEGMKR